MFNEKELNELIRCVEKEYYLNTKKELSIHRFSFSLSF